MGPKASVGPHTINSFKMSCKSHSMDFLVLVLSFCVIFCPFVRQILPNMFVCEMMPLLSRTPTTPFQGGVYIIAQKWFNVRNSENGTQLLQR